jgi:hypothetical protein
MATHLQVSFLHLNNYKNIAKKDVRLLLLTFVYLRDYVRLPPTTVDQPNIKLYAYRATRPKDEKLAHCAPQRRFKTPADLAKKPHQPRFATGKFPWRSRLTAH